MTNDIKDRLHDDSFRVTQLGRHDGELFVLPKPIEYAAKCIRLAVTEKSDDWQDTADKWIITIGKEVFDYYTGTGHRKGGEPKIPELSSVLYSLVMDANACDESFDDWCLNFGYDTNSRKALDTYLSCQVNATRLRKAGVYITEELKEFLQEY